MFAPNGECIARITSRVGQSCTNVAIGGEKRDRLYITESMTGTVLVADIDGLSGQAQRRRRARFDSFGSDRLDLQQPFAVDGFGDHDRGRGFVPPQHLAANGAI